MPSQNGACRLLWVAAPYISLVEIIWFEDAIPRHFPPVTGRHTSGRLPRQSRSFWRLLARQTRDFFNGRKLIRFRFHFASIICLFHSNQLIHDFKFIYKRYVYFNQLKRKRFEFNYSDICQDGDIWLLLCFFCWRSKQTNWVVVASQLAANSDQSC